ncbi:MAG: hypothetical protein IT441_04215 [Phycisphaeraceae bacterium]|nr:hypothetical protein [Phycisphaeraceae bacterium]
MLTNRVTVRVQLESSCKKMLDELCDRRGMTQIAVMTRLVNWFVEQNELIQAAVLGQLSAQAQQELARRLLQQMVGGRSRGPR